jgi:diguanylate cyclase
MTDLHRQLNSNPRRNMLFRALLFMSITATLASALATLVHWNQAHHGAIDLVIPPIVSIGFLLVSIYLYRHPGQYQRAAWINYFLGLCALAAPAWYYPVVAYQKQELLIDLLPPITAALFPLLLTLAVFVRPQRPVLTSALSWLLVAAPILTYLALHPAELLSPRGHDLAMTLGPVMLIVVAYLAVHRHVEAMALALHQQHQQLQVIAERDGLTQLYNRRAGEQALSEWALLANAMPQSFGVLMFDVDHFKRINDQHGHSTGDEVLRNIAQTANAVIRDTDVLARWGGEEFLLICKAVDHHQLSELAERIRIAIAAVDHPLVGLVTVSLGATMYRIDEATATTVQRADQALYEAKRNGRNRLWLS